MENGTDSKRGGWGTNLGFLMAAVGSAVGLGNIWGFPYKLGANGGFTFLLLYLLLVIFVGFVVMIGELVIGRKTGKSAVFAYVALSKKYKWVGFLGVASGFIILAFYSVLGGYVMKYMFSFLGQLFSGSMTGVPSGDFFGAFLGSIGQGTIFFALFQLVTILIVMGGISGGIEKFCKVAMPALLVILLAVIIRSVTLPGATAGLAFMFAPDFSHWSTFGGFIKTLRVAAGQMFFSLSLGMGCMITYGSYLSKKENLEFNAVFIP
ncbi:MAG: sodium-dependent transporter, partial [Clostridiales bacterium]|nr:sodium-dependent transporter [Clostridiales bacterium]